ncbi:hypothetical protein VNI00_007511 [Paramarasmius palmivorus]|uniref:C2H2-type domain-containing protein n=1 Tax=Paramarasmius palmivorus TaxID=297713 RepID=A0AAW0D444_9AGAR
MTSTTFTFPSPTVLGKRKAPEDPDYVLHLVSNPEATGHSESEYEPSGVEASSSKNALESLRGKPILLNGKLVAADAKKIYACTYDGCTKAYTKPARLAAHERSHTGERPFVCDTCGKSYLRETHLQAHARTHLPDTEKPLACTHENCTKRFWTQQHLRRHIKWHEGAKPFICSEPECDEVFSKHHQLRTHKCTVHAPPGTKPYQCAHPGCTQSFSTNQHLRTHQKVHNDKRYTCAHQDCLPTPGNPVVFFPTWNALQHHIRTVHPPTCPHPQCKGKTFTFQRNFRAHQKIHEQQELEAEMGTIDSDADGDAPQPPRKKRRGGEFGRDCKCEVEGCGKDFKSSKALAIHNKVTHLGHRDFACPHKDCGLAFGYKHLLQRHQAKAHGSSSSSGESDAGSGSEESSLNEEGTDAGPISIPNSMNIDALTGVSYATRSRHKLQNYKALRCPFPELGAIAHTYCDKQSQAASQQAPCDYVFSRAYDFRRHLRSSHQIEAEKESVEAWVIGVKASQKHR